MIEAGIAASEIIAIAGRRLAKPGAWTQHADARDRAGGALFWREGMQTIPGAVAWSFGFAVQDGVPLTRPFADVVDAVGAAIGSSTRNFYAACAATRLWNDDPARTHDDVIRALRGAYRLARQVEAKAR